MARLFAVLGLGFGDEGKGSIVDWLAAEHGAHTVCRFNGGAQAAHNVCLDDGRHHTFSQFGSGTLVPGTRTHLSRFMLVDPFALLVEAKRLSEVCGVDQPCSLLTIEREAIIMTPFHRAANRMREWLRGADRHGSCGVGIGEAVSESLERPEMTMRAGDLRYPAIARAKIQAQQANCRAHFSSEARLAGDLPPAIEHARHMIQSNAIVDHAINVYEEFMDSLDHTGAGLVDRNHLTSLLDDPADHAIIFEGAQGVLLDQEHGFTPHTTWSDCTFANAMKLACWLPFVERIGVLRTYATRHGAGPFPTEDPELNHPELHNAQHDWQGAFRQGHFDLELCDYARRVCRLGEFAGDCIALTHMDRSPRLAAMAHGALPSPSGSERPKPRYLELASGLELARLIENKTGRHVKYFSSGPTRSTKSEADS